MDSGYKVLGSMVVGSGFQSMESAYAQGSIYDITEVCCDSNEFSYNAPFCTSPSFKYMVSDTERTIKSIASVGMPWVKTLALPFKMAGANPQAIIRGTYPTFENKFCQIAPGNSSLFYILDRTDEALCLRDNNGTLLYKAVRSQFKDNFVPYNFIFELQAGGSGGAGTTYGKWSKNLDGAGGAGGAYAIGVMSFANPNWVFKISLSKGTAGGITSTPGSASSSSAGQSKIEVCNKNALNNPLTSIKCGGGVYAEIPVYEDSSTTRYSAGGNGGNVTFAQSTTVIDVNGNPPLYLIKRVSGGDGGDPVNSYVGASVSSESVSCVNVSGYMNNHNMYTYPGGKGGSAAEWGSSNPNDGGDWTGSGGGGGSASGNGGNARSGNGGLGAGGGGGYYSSYLTGGRGGDGFISIYY